uniref:Uncharacterized protein n=1 Tax=Amphimedon queenslandica TaxID=400682 RepID=A0A1X7SF31_AMPQE
TVTRKCERAKEVGIVGKGLSVTKMSTRSKDYERLKHTSSGIRNDKQCLLLNQW